MWRIRVSSRDPLYGVSMSISSRRSAWWVCGGIAFLLTVTWSWHRAEQRRREAIASAADRHIVDEINVLVEPQLRLLSVREPFLAYCGDFQSWEPDFWHRGITTSMFDENARWSLGFTGIAHFEKADVPVRVTIGRGPKRLRVTTNVRDPDLRIKEQQLRQPFIDENRRLYESRQHALVIDVLGSARHPDYVAGPPFRDGHIQ